MMLIAGEGRWCKRWSCH